VGGGGDGGGDIIFVKQWNGSALPEQLSPMPTPMPTPMPMPMPMPMPSLGQLAAPA
jgi:hypothetical protein